MTHTPASDTRHFYDDLAADYHLNYHDWDASVRRQGAGLDALIRQYLPGANALRVLDCSCGIGTQAIGLALQGHHVTGTDLSSKAIERARQEATRFGVDVTFAVADMRHLADVALASFDVVITCDNSLPHLLTDEDLHLALGSLHDRLRPGGLLIAGIRDYDRLAKEQPQFTPPQLTHDGDTRSVLFQLWDWAEDARTYQLTMFISKQSGPEWTTSTHVATYRALQRNELTQAAIAAGFHDPYWHMPPETGHHQPLITAIS